MQALVVALAPRLLVSCAAHGECGAMYPKMAFPAATAASTSKNVLFPRRKSQILDIFPYSIINRSICVNRYPFLDSHCLKMSMEAD